MFRHLAEDPKREKWFISLYFVLLPELLHQHPALCVALWDTLAMVSFVCWLGLLCLRWIPHYDCGITKHASLESVSWWISQHACQRTKATRKCKGQGRPGRRVALAGCGGEKNALSLWAEPRDGADGPMGNARGFDPMAGAHNAGFVPTPSDPDLPRLQTQLWFYPQPHSSVLQLPKKRLKGHRELL